MDTVPPIDRAMLPFVILAFLTIILNIVVLTGAGVLFAKYRRARPVLVAFLAWFVYSLIVWGIWLRGSLLGQEFDGVALGIAALGVWWLSLLVGGMAAWKIARDSRYHG